MIHGKYYEEVLMNVNHCNLRSFGYDLVGMLEQTLMLLRFKICSQHLRNIAAPLVVPPSELGNSSWSIELLGVSSTPYRVLYRLDPIVPLKKDEKSEVMIQKIA